MGGRRQSHRLAGKFLVKVASVSLVLHLRLERGGNLGGGEER